MTSGHATRPSPSTPATGPAAVKLAPPAPAPHEPPALVRPPLLVTYSREERRPFASRADVRKKRASYPHGNGWVDQQFRPKAVPPDRYTGVFLPDALEDARDWALRVSREHKANPKRWPPGVWMPVLLDMLDQYLWCMGFEWVPSELMAHDEGNKYLYAARDGDYVLKAYTSVTHGQTVARARGEGSLRITRVRLDAHLADIDPTARTKGRVNRTPCWPARYFDKLLLLRGTHSSLRIPKEDQGGAADRADED